MSITKNNFVKFCYISLYFVSFCSVLFLFVSPVFVSAFTADNAAGFAKQAAGTQGAGATETDVNVVAAKIAKGVFSTAGVIFFLLMFYGGYTWLMARGEEEQVKKAQNIIIAACIGLFIMVGSYAFTNFVLEKMISKEPPKLATEVSPGSTGGPLGCCLNEAQSPNSVMFNELNPNNWLSDVMEKDACNVWCKTCDDQDDVCGSIEEGTHCLFYEGVESPNTCWGVYAQQKNEE